MRQDQIKNARKTGVYALIMRILSKFSFAIGRYCGFSIGSNAYILGLEKSLLL